MDGDVAALYVLERRNPQKVLHHNILDDEHARGAAQYQLAAHLIHVEYLPVALY